MKKKTEVIDQIKEQLVDSESELSNLQSDFLVSRKVPISMEMNMFLFEINCSLLQKTNKHE